MSIKGQIQKGENITPERHAEIFGNKQKVVKVPRIAENKK